VTFRFPGRWPQEDPGPNPLSAAVQRRRDAGLPVVDLTLSNPTRAGLAFPENWEALLGNAAVRSYDPDPRGSAGAREAIARYYTERDTGRGASEARAGCVEPRDLFLTAGTSEAYSHLFKLLCGPGDAALVPRPSYPLLETLADLEGVTLHPYDLVPGARAGVPHPVQGTPWVLDRDDLLSALTPATRIVFVVHPNNPTGSLLSPEDAAWLLDLATRKGLAIVVDEVFADYRVNGSSAPRFPSDGPLVFTLNGLSKLLGLPQLKLAWIHLAGSPSLKTVAARHLEWMCDAYLSVGAAPQAACAELLRRRAEFQDPIRDRITANLATLREFAEKHPALQPLWPEAGWCLPVRCAGLIENGMDDEAFAIRLLATEGVLVQPGYFFDFEAGDRIVLSLLPEPKSFRQGLERIVRLLNH
jgi:aspartate/methionine/tyrosine aminotransferase